MLWFLTLASYFVAAALLGGLGSRLGRAAPWVAAAPFGAHLGVVLWSANEEGTRLETIEWIPRLGVKIGLEMDDLGLVLSAVVAVVGLLIVAYSSGYVRRRRHRFLALLTLFTGGMAGIVVSDELFGLFLFWEITTVASYLLIGFDDDKAAARAAALQAALVTTSGGLAMLGGFVLLANAAGTTSISEIVAAPPDGTVVTVALLLVFVGAFTKSAQAPFRFWLPGAMAAPTPASAFLHSATMVKAGIALLLFLEPGFGEHAVWSPVIATVGLVTMAQGAIDAMRQNDLKLLLAHGTVSQLGFMTALIGLGYTDAAVATLVAHAAFKASLFLVVGVVDTTTGTRDIRRLGGLARRAPMLATVGALGALSMAGIPPLLGFATKEAALDVLVADGAWLALGVIAAASVLTVSYSLRFWWGAFGGAKEDESVSPSSPSSSLIAAPAVLAIASLVIGVVPGPLGDVVASAVEGSFKLVLWPGLKPALAVSMTVIAVGVGLHLVAGRTRALGHARPLVPTGGEAYETSIRVLNRTADLVTGVLQNGSLPVYLAVILTAVLGLPLVVWLVTWDASPSLRLAGGVPEVALGLTVAVAAVAATRVQRRLSAALLLGVVGFGVAGIYVAFSAPDLALTQLLVETLTVAMFALVLSRLPRHFGDEPRSLSRRTRLAVAGFVGGFMTLAAVVATSVTPERSIADAYVANSIEAGGRNVVNVVLTNFRALDTLGEISVLAVAAIGVGILVRARHRSGEHHDGVRS